MRKIHKKEGGNLNHKLSYVLSGLKPPETFEEKLNFRLYQLLGEKEYIQINDYPLDDLKNVYQEELLLKYLERNFSLQELTEFEECTINEMRYMLGEVDIEYFAQAYFLHYIYTIIPKHHSKSYTELMKTAHSPRGQRIARAEPRGNAKTTRYDFIYPLWCALYKIKRYIIIVSASDNLAKEFLRSVKEELEENEYILEDFGDQKTQYSSHEKRNKKGKWTENVLQLSNGCRLESQGWQSALRGKKNRSDRPDLFIVDDIEKDDSKTSETIREKMDDTFFTALVPAGSATTDIIVIGTILHIDSLLMKVLNNYRYDSQISKAIITWADRQDLWDEWKHKYTAIGINGGVAKARQQARKFYEDHQEEMLKGSEVLWKGKDSYGDYYALMEEFLELGETRFAQEKQNEPMDPTKNIFHGKLQYYTDLPSVNEFDFLVGAVDPSLGKGKNSDFSAIIWIGFHQSGFIYVLEADLKRRHPNKIILDLFSSYQRMIDLYGRSRAKGIAVESVAFQEFFKDKIKEEGARKRIYPPIKPVYPHSDKSLRIADMEPDVANGYIKFNRNHRELVKQFEYFTLELNYFDDGPDTLKMALDLGRGKGQSYFYVSGQRSN